jgi:hypothetical protein
MGTIGEASGPQGAKQEVAGLIAREQAARTVAAMRGRGETDEENPRPGIAKRRKRPRPIELASKPARRIGRHLLPPGDQTRAALTGDDLPRDPRE